MLITNERTYISKRICVCIDFTCHICNNKYNTLYINVHKAYAETYINVYVHTHILYIYKKNIYQLLRISYTNTCTHKCTQSHTYTDIFIFMYGYTSARKMKNWAYCSLELNDSFGGVSGSIICDTTCFRDWPRFLHPHPTLKGVKKWLSPLTLQDKRDLKCGDTILSSLLPPFNVSVLRLFKLCLILTTWCINCYFICEYITNIKKTLQN